MLCCRTYRSESGAPSDFSTERKVARNEEMMDVRNFETMDHKMLKQWEEKNPHLGNNHFGKGHHTCIIHICTSAAIIFGSCGVDVFLGHIQTTTTTNKPNDNNKHQKLLINHVTL